MKWKASHAIKRVKWKAEGTAGKKPAAKSAAEKDKPVKSRAAKKPAAKKASEKDRKQ